MSKNQITRAHWQQLNLHIRGNPHYSDPKTLLIWEVFADLIIAFFDAEKFEPDMLITALHDAIQTVSNKKPRPEAHEWEELIKQADDQNKYTPLHRLRIWEEFGKRLGRRAHAYRQTLPDMVSSLMVILHEIDTRIDHPQ